MDEVSHPRNKDIPPRKLRLTVPWTSVCAALEQQAGQHGLPNEMLRAIWKIIKHPNSPVNVNITRQLILCMMPDKEVVDSDLIENVIYAISHHTEKVGAEPIKLTFLQYLIGKFSNLYFRFYSSLLSLKENSNSYRNRMHSCIGKLFQDCSSTVFLISRFLIATSYMVCFFKLRVTILW